MHRTTRDKVKVMVSPISSEVWEYLAEVEWVSQVKDKVTLQEWVVKEMVELRNSISKIPDRRRVRDVNRMIH
jgi:hypothetical protein